MPLIPTEGAQLRRALLAAALEEWRGGIECRRDADRISRYFSACGWQRHLDQHSGGVFDEDIRRATPHLEYCGLFVGWCGLQVGNYLHAIRCVPVRLKPAIAEFVLPSTYRAQSAAHWARAGLAMPAPVGAGDLQPGDIITLRTRAEGAKAYGDHVAIVEYGAGSLVHTVEANASGMLGPDKRPGRGVVRRRRLRSDVRGGLRLSSEHFEHVEDFERMEEVS
ncbi:hypothetical protein DV096_16695 [Bradymonadaceae bacterium TMQ3]|nr:hypothetical protein DV096_16695 [Bradymonadaceae bacterium TMQ3]TXC69349.1 CHAP domain-containing protein [Bradymonadales bacterium TMQ1]